MRRVWFLILPLFVSAQSYSLKNYIENAGRHNQMIHAKTLQTQAKAKEIDAAQSDFWPTLDIAATHTMTDPTTVIAPGQSSSALAHLAFDIYDGGRKDAVLNARSFEYRASLYEKQAFEKSVTLQIIDSFFTIKKFTATLHALEKRSVELKTQIERMEKFTGAGLATSEDVDRLRSAYDNNIYKIESMKLAIEQYRQNLALQSGLPAGTLRENHLMEPRHIRYEAYEKSKILHAHAKALKENAKAIESAYIPHVSVEDSYSLASYSDIEALPGFPSGGNAFFPEHQNHLSLSASMRLFDNGKLKKESEAVRYQKLALDSEKIYADKEQRLHFKVSRSRLKTERSKIKSAKSALRAAKSTYGSIKKKYEVGMVDNVTYLDALTQLTLARARYKETLYDYEIAKSIYYYYAGKDPREFVR